MSSGRIPYSADLTDEEEGDHELTANPMSVQRAENSLVGLRGSDLLEPQQKKLVIYFLATFFVFSIIALAIAVAVTHHTYHTDEVLDDIINATTVTPTTAPTELLSADPTFSPTAPPAAVQTR
jgi:hypothetical protein